MGKWRAIRVTVLARNVSGEVARDSSDSFGGRGFRDFIRVYVRFRIENASNFVPGARRTFGEQG